MSENKECPEMLECVICEEILPKYNIVFGLCDYVCLDCYVLLEEGDFHHGHIFSKLLKIFKKGEFKETKEQELEEINRELGKHYNDTLLPQIKQLKERIEELEEHLEDVMGCSHKQAIEILELEEKLGLDKIEEEEAVDPSCANCKLKSDCDDFNPPNICPDYIEEDGFIVPEESDEQNKIIATISVVSSEVDLDSPILKRSKMPRLTEFPGDIKEEEEIKQEIKKVEQLIKSDKHDGFILIDGLPVNIFEYYRILIKRNEDNLVSKEVKEL